MEQGEERSLGTIASPSCLNMFLFQQLALSILQMKTGVTGIHLMNISGKRSRPESTNGESAIIAQPAIGLKPGAQHWAIDSRFTRESKPPA
jgi:hypothetical protein